MSMARFYGINRYFHMRVQNPPHIQNKTFHTWSAWKFTFGTVIASSYMFACCSIFSSVQLRLILRLNLVTFRKNAEYECGSLSPMLFLSHHRQPFYCNDKIIRYSIRFGMKKCSQTTAFRSFHSFTCANISKKTSIKQPPQLHTFTCDCSKESHRRLFTTVHTEYACHFTAKLRTLPFSIFAFFCYRL